MQDFKVLLSGIDTLNLSLDIVWLEQALLPILRTQLEEAKRLQAEIPFILEETDNAEGISFMLKPHGSNGYAWLLLGQDYALRIMDLVAPRSRPNVMVEIRSEYLWRVGFMEAVRRILDALTHHGGVLIKTRPSRVDACMDLFFPAESWSSDLLDYMVTQAANSAIYHSHKELTGISIGRGDMSARIYDKGREIESQSGKTWFHDLWKLDENPDGMKVIRIEFQLRRSPLRELGFKEIDTIVLGLEHLWAYCTQKWLKFQSNPGCHHTQRQTLPWWKTVQTSFLGLCEGEPLIRAKAIENDKKRLRQQATGLCSSLIALGQDGKPPTDERQAVSFMDYPETMAQALKKLGKTPEELQEDIARKLAKRSRLRAKYAAAQSQRERLGIIQKAMGIK